MTDSTKAMKQFDVYGFYDDDIERAKDMVKTALDIELQPHQGSFYGDYYSYGQEAEENFVLQQNYHDVEEEWFEAGYKEFPVLLYVNLTSRSAEIERSLKEGTSSIVPLRRTTL